jgi:hypothetical protein
MSAVGVRRRPALAPLPAAVALVAGCLALAALSLLGPSVPSYDPFAWLVWGRELVSHGQTLDMAGGPSWKPLPVFFTAPFALAGGAAPYLWLLVVRAGALLGLAGAFALGRRLAGAWAGAIAAVALLLTQEYVSLAARGASEPLLIACVLWAVERHLAGRRGTAFALGVGAALIRPEAWPFLGLYALWYWRASRGRERALIAGGLALVPLAWFGPPAVAGEIFAAGAHAAKYNGHTGSDPGWTALKRGVGLVVAPVWLLALAAVWLRRGDLVVRRLALGAVAWLALVVAMTAAGFPGLPRFMLPPAAIACVLAGAGASVAIASAGIPSGGVIAGSRTKYATPAASLPDGRRTLAIAALLLLACAVLSAPRVGALGDQVRDARDAVRKQDELTRAIAVMGGRAGVLACGGVAVNHTAQTALAWKLHARLDRVGTQLDRPGIVFAGPQSIALGGPPRLTLDPPYVKHRVGHAGVWRMVVVLPPHTPLPQRCGPRA